MTVSNPAIESFAFEGETAGTSAASALKKIKILTEKLPAGRLFDAISTLSDKSAAAAIEYEKAAIAVLRQEIAEAEANFAKADLLARELDELLSDQIGQIALPLPAYMKKRR